MAINTNNIVMIDKRFDQEPIFSPIGSADRKFHDREDAHNTLGSAQETFAQLQQQRVQRGMGTAALGEGKHVKLIQASEQFAIPVRTRTTPPKHRADGEL